MKIAMLVLVMLSSSIGCATVPDEDINVPIVYHFDKRRELNIYIEGKNPKRVEGLSGNFDLEVRVPGSRYGNWGAPSNYREVEYLLSVQEVGSSQRIGPIPCKGGGGTTTLLYYSPLRCEFRRTW